MTELSDTTLQTYRSERYIFWRKVYIFSAICFLSAFVICWTHFGHHFGLNEDNFVDFIEWEANNIETNLSDDKQEHLNNSIEKLIDESPFEEVIDQLEDIFTTIDQVENMTDTEEEPILDTMEDTITSIKNKLDHLDSDQGEIKINILNIDKYQENIDIQLKNLTERVNLIDETMLDIKDDIIVIKTTLKMILANQQKTAGLSNSVETNKKEKKENKKEKAKSINNNNILNH